MQRIKIWTLPKIILMQHIKIWTLPKIIKETRFFKKHITIKYVH